MDTQTVPRVEQTEQHPLKSTIQCKVGVEVVRSADLESCYFRGPRPGRSFRVFTDNEAWAELLAAASVAQ